MTESDKLSGEGTRYLFEDPPIWYKAIVWLCFLGIIAIMLHSLRIWLFGVS